MSSEVSTRRLCAAALLLALAFTSLIQTGCTRPIRRLGVLDELAIAYRDRVWAQRAFNLRFANCNREYADHFKNGFCAGYTDVSGGGDGYLPALPPEEYRSYEYQCAEGSKCVDSWFDGYPAGVAAAREDKAGNYSDVHVSRLIERAVTQQNAPNVLPSDVPVTRPSSTLQPPSRQATVPTRRFGSFAPQSSTSSKVKPSNQSILSKPVAPVAPVTPKVVAPRAAKVPSSVPVTAKTPVVVNAAKPLTPPIISGAAVVSPSTKVPPIVQGSSKPAGPVIRGRKIDPSTSVSANEIPLPMAVRSSFDTRSAAWPVTRR